MNLETMKQVLALTTALNLGQLTNEQKDDPMLVLAFVHMFEELRGALKAVDICITRMKCTMPPIEAIPVEFYDALDHADHGIADLRVELAHLMGQLEKQYGD